MTRRKITEYTSDDLVAYVVFHSVWALGLGAIIASLIIHLYQK